MLNTTLLLDFSLRTKLGALDALNIFDQTENRITLQRSVIGAFQSRLTSALSQLQSTTETYQTAYSRIVDADIAVESANLVRTQILQQSAMAVLAQANLSSNIALTLLGV